MPHPRPLLFLALITAAATLTACSSSRSNSEVVIDNRSAVPLQVEVTTPSKGVFGRKPSLEGFVTRVEPGASWASTPDTRRWSMEPNPNRAFRVVVMEHEATPPLTYDLVWFETGKAYAHLVFSGPPGSITCQPHKENGAAAGPEERLQAKLRTAEP
jgi:hypothetical protein